MLRIPVHTKLQSRARRSLDCLAIVSQLSRNIRATQTHQYISPGVMSPFLRSGLLRDLASETVQDFSLR